MMDFSIAQLERFFIFIAFLVVVRPNIAISQLFYYLIISNRHPSLNTTIRLFYTE